MTLKQKNKLLTEELQKAKDKIVNLQENLKQEQIKRFKLEHNAKDVNKDSRVKRNEKAKKWQ